MICEKLKRLQFKKIYNESISFQGAEVTEALHVSTTNKNNTLNLFSYL